VNSDESASHFECFGTDVSVHVSAAADPATAALRRAESVLLEVHRRLSRFDDDSEICAVNSDLRETVSVSPLFLDFAEAVVWAGELTDGLVDATQLAALEQAGYRRSRRRAASLPLPTTLAQAGARSRAAAHPARPWRELGIDRTGGTLTRPPGVRLDSGGIAKGLAADLVAKRLWDVELFAVDCGGDIRVGGIHSVPRVISVADPFGGDHIHELELTTGAIATSGIGVRSWKGPDGRPAHHLIDPASGRPAFTGLVQATALAPTALEAEARAKAALLSGPGGASRWLPHGGMIVNDHGDCEVLAVPPRGVMALA
jgi:FAD:protein FMN transferase